MSTQCTSSTGCESVGGSATSDIAHEPTKSRSTARLIGLKAAITTSFVVSVVSAVAIVFFLFLLVAGIARSDAEEVVILASTIVAIFLFAGSIVTTELLCERLDEEDEIRAAIKAREPEGVTRA